MNRSSTHSRFGLPAAAMLATLCGCQEPPSSAPLGPAPGVSGDLGQPMPFTVDLDAFDRGKTVFSRRFDRSDGLGPAFNVSSCAACHDKPVAGGGSGLVHNFMTASVLPQPGALVPAESAALSQGVLRMFSYDPALGLRPRTPTQTTAYASRNSIPIFGSGLLAEISGDEILSRADPDDADADGISGRANFDNGAVGRFGRKAQAASIEAFIRAEFFAHLGITSEPLNEAQRAGMPSDLALALEVAGPPKEADRARAVQQVAAAGEMTHDDDGVADPELTGRELMYLVKFVLLLAAPQAEEPTPAMQRGRALFDEARCSACHVPELAGPRGAVAAWSDLLLHDMGPELADGIEMGEAGGAEFRTQPLWGVAAAGPYLHDGRAATLEAAILAHAGEAATSRDMFARFDAGQQRDLLEFLKGLGGGAQAGAGLLSADAAIPGDGEYGGPFRPLTFAEERRFVHGRALFDREFGLADGLGGAAGPDGAPRFNADSCRGCHFDPVIGGAGPRGVNVMRQGRLQGQTFFPPIGLPGTILHRHAVGAGIVVRAADGVNVLEHRQTPHSFGLGLIEGIADATIAANADPADANGDGIRGRVHVLPDGRIGRFGWKAHVPSLADFIRDALTNEMGLTVADQEGLSFGAAQDGDGVADPEFGAGDAADMEFFLSMLAGPPRQAPANADRAEHGAALFAMIGCAACHVPALPGSMGEVALYSDLLLHEILPEGAPGIASGAAGPRDFRTAPLWGLSRTAPYWHSGEADTIEEAILLHDGEGAVARQAFQELDPIDRLALLEFLATL